ncbi:MAG: nuclear transport factor 2 family protein [Actinomyces sp.]|nr:nuclear transport factor 2 family protein [Actinomyces sp.]
MTTTDTTATRVLETSKHFWAAMEASDTTAMRAAATPECRFVHIGVTCDLDRELQFYDDGTFQPAGITFHSQDVTVHGAAAVVISDIDYSLLLNGEETTHHFAVTEVYVSSADDETWRLLQLSFTALVY